MGHEVLDETALPALPPPDAEVAPPRTPLLPERSDFLEGDAPAAEKVEAFLARAFSATDGDTPARRGAGALDLRRAALEPLGQSLRPRSDGLRAPHGDPGRRPAPGHGRPREVLQAGAPGSRHEVRNGRPAAFGPRGTYHQLAAKGLIAWETAQDIGVIKAPAVQKNSTPSLTERQAIALLEAIPTETLQGIRDLALMSVFFITGCRVSAIVHACVGHLESDGVEHYLHVTEKRNKKRRKILLEAARPVRAYLERAGIGEDKEGPLFRPMKPDGTGLERRHLDRKTPWRLVKKYCRAAGIDPDRLGGRGIGIHSLRKTAINDAIRNGASLHEVATSPGTRTSGRPSSTSCARRRTPRWRPDASTFASRDAGACEHSPPRPSAHPGAITSKPEIKRVVSMRAVWSGRLAPRKNLNHLHHQDSPCNAASTGRTSGRRADRPRRQGTGRGDRRHRPRPGEGIGRRGRAGVRANDVIINNAGLMPQAPLGGEEPGGRLAQPAARTRDDDDFAFDGLAHVALRVPFAEGHFAPRCRFLRDPSPRFISRPAAAGASGQSTHKCTWDGTTRPDGRRRTSPLARGCPARSRAGPRGGHRGRTRGVRCAGRAPRAAADGECVSVRWASRARPRMA